MNDNIVSIRKANKIYFMPDSEKLFVVVTGEGHTSFVIHNDSNTVEKMLRELIFGTSGTLTEEQSAEHNSRWNRFCTRDEWYLQEGNDPLFWREQIGEISNLTIYRILDDEIRIDGSVLL